MPGEHEALMITASELIEHLFCPRFTYYELVLHVPEHQHIRPKVQKGRTIHRIKQLQNRTYLRKKLGCVKREFQVYLASPGHHIRGIVDEVLELDDGTRAVLDYKFSKLPRKIYRTHRWKLVFYSLLVSLAYNCPVKRGFLLYTRDNNKVVEMPIRARDFEKLEELVNEIFEVIARGCFPPPAPHPVRCADCCYRNICPEGF